MKLRRWFWMLGRGGGRELGRGRRIKGVEDKSVERVGQVQEKRQEEEDGDMELDLLLPTVEPREFMRQILTEMRQDHEREWQLNDTIFENYVTIGRILQHADKGERHRQANRN